MANKNQITEEEFETEMTRTHEMGVGYGLKQASEKLLDEAADLFRNGGKFVDSDKVAKMLREMAKEIREKADEKIEANKRT